MLSIWEWRLLHFWVAKCDFCAYFCGGDHKGKGVYLWVTHWTQMHWSLSALDGICSSSAASTALRSEIRPAAAGRKAARGKGGEVLWRRPAWKVGLHWHHGAVSSGWEFSTSLSHIFIRSPKPSYPLKVAELVVVVLFSKNGLNGIKIIYSIFFLGGGTSVKSV